jgi:very-short-patch-repair endonuclease
MPTTPALTDLIARQDHVIRVSSAIGAMTRTALRWQVVSGRWQKPCHGIIVTHSGPITGNQRLWIALLAAGPGAVLAGLTAARLDGFRGFDDCGTTYLLLPAGQHLHRKPAGPPVVAHYSTFLGPGDVHPLRQPPRTRIARSLIDAASWMTTDRGTQAVLAAGVQQRLVRVEDLTAVVAANQRLRRRALIRETLGDIAGGAQALSELDFTRLVVRAYRLPEPERQVRRKDSAGRNRYLDVVWVRERLVVEIDGAQHADPLNGWDDMSRDNDLVIDGYRVLRFPAWLVRYHPEYVAARIRAALAKEPKIV